VRRQHSFLFLYALCNEGSPESGVAVISRSQDLRATVLNNTQGLRAPV